MIDAPLIFRIAGWPVETIRGLRSVDLAHRVDLYVEREAAIRRAADELSDRIHPLVPLTSNREARRKLLALRRALHRSTAPVAITEPLVSELIEEVPEALRIDLRKDCVRRCELAQERGRLEELYGRRLRAELTQLYLIAGEDRFQKALAIASPAAFDEFSRWRTDRSERLDWRLIRTLLQFVLRAVGRATPNGLWAGVALESGETDRGIRAEPCEVSIRFQPVLKPIAQALRAMTLRQPWFTQIPLRLNPTLFQTASGPWRFERPENDGWHTAEVPDSPLMKILVSRYAKSSALLPVEIQQHFESSDTEWLMRAAQDGLFLSCLSFPEFYASAWDALDKILEQIPQSEKTTWQAAFTALRRICSTLSEPFEQLSTAEVRSGIYEAREIVNRLVARYGIPVLAEDANALTVDYRAPFRMLVAKHFKDKLSDAVRLVWRFDRLGIGEAAAQRERRGELPDEAWADRWHQELQGVHRKRQYRFQVTAAAQPMPPGSCLMRLQLNGDEPLIRIGCISADPVLFYSRFDHLLGESDAGKRLQTWYRSSLEETERAYPSLRFADLALRSPIDLNAAARPRFSPRCVDPFERGPVDTGQTSTVVVPLIHSAVSLDTSDRYTRQLGNQHRMLGRSSLMRPLPALPMERTEWHHLPRLELSEDAILTAERWTFSHNHLDEFAAATGLDRFISWRRFLKDTDMPELLYAHTEQHTTEWLLPAQSVLATEILGRSIPGLDGEIRFQEAFPDVETTWLTDGHDHYLAEVVAAWQGDPEFWEEYVR